MEQPKDTTAKAFFSQKAIAADFCNAFLYDGERVVKPEDLKEKPTELRGLPKRLRDLLYLCTSCTDGKTTYVFLGMEFQSKPDRTMLFRAMEYDARQYRQQFRKRKKTEAMEPLRPVVTFVLNFGKRRWNYPTSVHGTFAEMDPRLRQFVPNYHINLIDCQRLSTEQLGLLTTELRTVLGAFANANTKHNLLKDLAAEAPNGCLSVEAVDLLNAYLDLKIPVEPDNKEEDVNMCKAIRYWEQKMRAEGVKIGEEKIKKNLEEIIIKGLQKNVPKKLLQELTGLSLRKIRAIQSQLA